MAATQVPLGDLTTDEKGAIYIGALERKLTQLTLNEMRYRTLLEMLTGQQWEEISTHVTAGDLKKLAVTATQRRLARSMEQCERIVESNLAAANETAQSSESV